MRPSPLLWIWRNQLVTNLAVAILLELEPGLVPEAIKRASP